MHTHIHVQHTHSTAGLSYILQKTVGTVGTPKYEPPPEERVSFSVRVVKYWNKLPASIVTAPSVNIFKKRLEKVWTGVFPHLPH